MGKNVYGSAPQAKIAAMTNTITQVPIGVVRTLNLNIYATLTIPVVTVNAAIVPQRNVVIT